MVYLVYGLVSAMGNKPSASGQRTLDLSRRSDAAQSNLQVHLSEEDYLPMTSAMRRALKKKTFERIVPHKTAVHDIKSTAEEEQRDKDDKAISKNSDTTVLKPLEIERDDEESFASTDVKKTRVNVEPVVTVVMHTTENQSNDRMWPETLKKSTMECLSETFKKSPTLTNRRFSLIDLNTSGIKKSTFTLELEERLRQSKLELGFDADLNNWKEFSYTFESSGDKKNTKPTNLEKKIESVNNERNISLSEESGFSSRSKKFCPKDPPQYCAHTCQILGLCSLGKPEIMSRVEASPFKDKSSQKYDISHMMSQREDVISDIKNHGKKDDCNCDHCTLAYLTDMDMPRDIDCRRRTASGGSRDFNKDKGSNFLERMKIIDKGNICKSIEISMPNIGNIERPRYTCKTNASGSNASVVTIKEDITNYKIKEKFKKNNPLVFQSMDGNKHYNDTSRAKFTRVNNSQNHSFTSVSRNSISPRRSDSKKSSASTLGASVSSSLSTIMSYRRVRQLFQTIIEKNRSKKRTKRNINKFIEMEELGLGEVKNNRWYPSDSKTFSIWKDMHSNVHGVQAQFKKYPKTTSNRGK